MSKTIQNQIKHITIIPENVYDVLSALYECVDNSIIMQWIAKIEQRPELRVLKQQLFAATNAWPLGKMRADISGCLSGDWRYIQPGTFVMGSPQNEPGHFIHEIQHDVKITYGFWLKTTPVTQSEWQALMGNNPSNFKGDPNRPVESVSWFDAVAYCNNLSRQEGFNEAYILKNIQGYPGEENFTCDVIWKGFECNGYRLPTEAEWEYAARAGTTTGFYNGHCLNATGTGKDKNLNDIGWYDLNSDNITHAVKCKTPNKWGLYDMLGNVFEWCWDWHESYPSKCQHDPRGPSTSTDSSRVIRGGSWLDSARDARAARRCRRAPNFRNYVVGLRCARTNLK